MIVRTWSSAMSASWTNGPQLDRSAGMSSVSNQGPLTWPNRSSCGRMAGFMPSRASSRMLRAPTRVSEASSVGVKARGSLGHARTRTTDFPRTRRSSRSRSAEPKSSKAYVAPIGGRITPLSIIGTRSSHCSSMKPGRAIA